MNISLILAKNHMVTKHNSRLAHVFEGLILAKNHMVTKLNSVPILKLDVLF